MGIASAGIFALAANGKEAIANIQIPLDITTPDEIEPYFVDILSSTDILGSIADLFPSDRVKESARKFGEWCADSGEKLQEELEKAYLTITENLPEATKNALILTEKEKIQHVNRPGFEYLQKSILLLRTKEKNSGRP
jgi:hypothetical protein